MRLAVVVMVGVVALMAACTAAAQSATATYDLPTSAIDPASDPGGSATPAPTSAPASPEASSSHSSQPTSPSLPTLTQDQANGLFDGFLVHGFVNATDGARDSQKQLVDDANLVTTTPADWTYQQSTVTALQHTVLQMSNAVVALVIF